MPLNFSFLGWVAKTKSDIHPSAKARVFWRLNDKVLEIELHHGEIYQYVGVPAAVYKGLINAESHGKYFNAQIKGTYPYRQLR